MVEVASRKPTIIVYNQYWLIKMWKLLQWLLFYFCFFILKRAQSTLNCSDQKQDLGISRQSEEKWKFRSSSDIIEVHFTLWNFDGISLEV